MTDRRTFLKSSLFLVATAAAASEAGAIGFVTAVRRTDEVIADAPQSGSAAVVLSRNPTLKWTAVPGAVRYSVAVAKAPGGRILWSERLAGLESRVATPLEFGTTYVVEMMAVGSDGRPRKQTKALFRVVDPAKPK